MTKEKEFVARFKIRRPKNIGQMADLFAVKGRLESCDLIRLDSRAASVV